MRILVLGAGAVGGYFGGRLAAAGRDVTFLVRPPRAKRLAEDGLVIRSPHGDLTVSDPVTVTADAVDGPYDLILLSAKAYDLDSALDAIAPAVGSGTAVLPLLNGMRHLDLLDKRFGPGTALGGLCMIAAVLDPDGTIRHLNDLHLLVHGERGTDTTRIAAIDAALADAGFDSRRSDDVLAEMWEKWVFIATGAGITSLMRAPVGDIVAAGGTALTEQLIAEAAAIAAGAGYAPRPQALENTRTMFTTPGSLMTASMLRDIEQGARVEVDHVLGDLLARSSGPDPAVLRTAYVHVKAYEARRAREAGS